MINVSIGDFTIEMKQWEAEAEVLRYLKYHSDRQLILGGNDSEATIFYSLRASPQLLESETVGIAIFAQDGSLLPQIVLQHQEQIVVGFNSQVAFIDLTTGKLKSEVELPFLFFAFSFIDEYKTLLAISELGVVAFSTVGQEIWRFDGQDVLTDWKLQGNVLKLAFMDEEAKAISVETGERY